MTATADTLGFATLVRQFFCGRLVAQQNASARTVASYRDTFRLLLNDRRFRNRPMVLETPKEGPNDADMDVINLATLRGLIGVKRPTKLHGKSSKPRAMKREPWGS